MNSASKALRVGAVFVAASVAMAGCSGNIGSSGIDGPYFSMAIGKPGSPLVPGATVTNDGIQIMETIFTGLVQYNAVSTDAEYSGVARLIETADNTTFRISLHENWSFHDGTPVTSDSFINAWNYTAAPKNQMASAYSFRTIKGFEELQQTSDYQTGMSGLRKIDDLTFEVELTKPFAQWPLATGYLAFAPLPQAFFDDPDSFGRKPIGNGPWMAEEELDETTGIVLRRFPDYAGVNKAKVERMEYRFFTDSNASYREAQADSVDISRVPTSAVSSAKTLFGDRYVQRNSGVFTFFGFPLNDERFKDKRVRQALSMAIDRREITDTIFDGTRAPARSVVSPMIAGARLDACTMCDLDVERARQLLDESGFDTSEPIELTFNAGGDHETWVTAVGNQLKENLGINYRLKGTLQLGEYFKDLESGEATGPFRMGWGMDYPSAQNYLEPLFSADAIPPKGTNMSRYKSQKFDELIRRAEGSRTNEEAIDYYQQAEDVVLEDMPVIPLFFGLAQFVHSREVQNVKISGFERIVTTDVTLTR